MRAIVAPRGLPSNDPGCLVAAEVAEPVLAPHDLLIQVEAIAVNPVDTKVRASLPPEGPARILGWDGAGTVLATGAAVRELGLEPGLALAAGDPVWFAGDITRAGCQAERVAVDARLCARRPASLTAAAAAALPLTGLTAWEALFDRLGNDPDGGSAGRSLLILGGAGGVGSIAIQLARRAGLQVVASASRPESQAWVRDLGADAVVDHHAPLAPQLAALGLPQVDQIACFSDTDSHWAAMAELIRPQGAIVAIVGNRAPLDLNLLKAKSASFHWEYMFTRAQFRTADMARQGEILARLAALVDGGELRSTMTRLLEPIDAANLRLAHGLLEEGRMIGKLVLQGWPGGAPQGGASTG